MMLSSAVFQHEDVTAIISGKICSDVYTDSITYHQRRGITNTNFILLLCISVLFLQNKIIEYFLMMCHLRITHFQKLDPVLARNHISHISCQEE